MPARGLAACGRPAWEVTREDVDRVVGELAAQGLAASTRRLYVQVFKNFHAFLVAGKAVAIEAAFGIRLADPVDEFNAARHVGADSVRGCPCDPAAGSPRSRTYSGQRRRGRHRLPVFAQVRDHVEVQAGAVCKTVGSAYVGSNPTPATTWENGPIAAETRPGGPFSSCPAVCHLVAL